MASTGRKVHLLLLIVINVLLTNPIHGAADSDANPTGPMLTENDGSSLMKKTQPTTTTTPWVITHGPNREVIIDSRDDIRSIVTPDADVSTQKGSVVFFSGSLSIFATIGIVIFCRKCVRCPAHRHARRHHFQTPTTLHDHEPPIGVLVDDCASLKMLSPSSPTAERNLHGGGDGASLRPMDTGMESVRIELKETGADAIYCFDQQADRS